MTSHPSPVPRPPSPDSDVLIKVDGVSKKFCRSLRKSLWYGLCDIGREVAPWAQRRESRVEGREPEQRANPLAPDPKSDPIRVHPCSSVVENIPQENSALSATSAVNPPGLRPDEFWAVNNVSFELKRGECLGLIGRNGAGKTTLLKMLNGLIKPDRGSITMRGRVGALIALGAGFNPLLTGRENIYIGCAVLGMSKKEIDAKVDEIIDFAEIGEFIDSPVQSYSSGMGVRLGFAVATSIKPDVLLLDEVLAVGDAAFRHKCYSRLAKLLDNAAVIMVTHSMDYVGHVSDCVLLMNRGFGQWFRDPLEGISGYNTMLDDASLQTQDGGTVVACHPPVASASARIPSAEIAYGRSLDVEVEFELLTDAPDLIFSFTVINSAEQPVMNWHSSRLDHPFPGKRGKNRLRFSINPLLLHPGRYRWNLAAAERGSINHCIWMMRAGDFLVSAPFRPLGNIPYLAELGSPELVHLGA